MSKRKNNGLKLLAKGKVFQVREGEFIVKSERGDGEYRVVWSRDRWVCSCPDFRKKGAKCKHIYASLYYMAVRDVRNAVMALRDDRKCMYCEKGDEVIKKGVRYNKSGPVQLYYCKRCKRKFSARTGFSGMKKRAEAIVAALDLYFRGLSLRQVAQHLRASYKIEVSHKTVHNWIKKYVRLVNEFVKSANLNSDRWHADESVVKVRGEHIRIWTLLDSETRFVLAIHVSKSRGADDAVELFKKGFKVSKKPEELVTDGLKSYEKAAEQELPDIIHVQSSLREGMNNKMERFFKELRRRVKTTDGFKTQEGVEIFADGYSIYHNFIKEHGALNDLTPAQFAGLFDGRDWLGLILRATKLKGG